MRKYISHISAARMWGIPQIDAFLGDASADVHVTFTQLGSRKYKPGQVTHLCQGDLPNDAIVIHNGIRVASPELVFLQLAAELDIQRTILLGLQLCGHAPGCPGEAVTTKYKLKNFAEKAVGTRGRPNALRALRSIEGGSASIMESFAFMVLCLPYALGGYGLGSPIFNYEIKMKESRGHPRDPIRCFIDLYYVKEKLGIEYNSFEFHHSPLSQGRDTLRASALERQGIEIMSLSTIQLYDRKACENFALNLSRRIGKRMQIKSDKFLPMQQNLRSLFPRANRV